MADAMPEEPPKPSKARVPTSKLIAELLRRNSISMFLRNASPVLEINLHRVIDHRSTGTSGSITPGFLLSRTTADRIAARSTSKARR